MSLYSDIEEIINRLPKKRRSRKADYGQFEEYFRSGDAIEGRKEELAALVREVAAMYVAANEKKPNSWLDIGCGTGNSLDAVAEIGVNSVGVEADKGLAQTASEEGRCVLNADAEAALKEIVSDGLEFDVISILHLLEHLNPTSAEKLVSLCAKALSAGGLLVVVVPEIADARVAGESFYRDPTHIRPYPARLLSYYLHRAGLLTEFTTAYDRTFSRSSEQQKIAVNNRITGLTRLKRAVDEI